MTTRYPGALDGYEEVRIVADRFDEIVADDHNSLRSAVVAIEQTLGVNPQGIFGTVVERLEDAYGSLQAHVAGHPPRHRDSVIESPLRTGSPYFDLAAGTVGTQLQQLLDFVNSPMYGGSLPEKFRNGEFLLSGPLDGSLTELIARLGDIGGAARVGFPGTTDSFADGYALPQSSISQAINQIVASLGGLTGAEKLGLEDVVSQPRHDFTLSGPLLAAALGQTANILEEQSRIPNFALSGFVIDNMVAARADGYTVDISEGSICVRGRYASFAGTALTHGGVGEYLVYARINEGGEVEVDIVDKAAPDAVEIAMGVNGKYPAVPLMHFEESGAPVWAVQEDLRRFGKWTNNKPYFTVGSDGYGADFTSLQSAIAYVELLSLAAGGVSVPRKIVLSSNIEIPVGSTPISLPSQIEIDGAGHFIEWSTDTSLFYSVDGSNVVLKDIRALFASGSDPDPFPNAAFYVNDAAAANLNNIAIRNCSLLNSGSSKAYHFVILEASGVLAISDIEISGCHAEVLEAAFYTPVNSATFVRLINNRFFQTSVIATGSPGIVVGSHSMVVDNQLNGGWLIGVKADNGENTVIHNNVIDGGTGSDGYSGNAMMSTGIQFNTSSADFAARALISDNLVKGTADYGIAVSVGANSASHIVISGNIIDNTFDTALGQTGILCDGDETLVVGNYILFFGTAGISNASHAIGNVIWGNQSTVTHAIGVKAGLTRAIIADNYVRDVEGLALDAGSGGGHIIHGNYLRAPSGFGVDSAISVLGSQCLIANNYISRYGTGLASGIVEATGSWNLILGNYVENCKGTTFVLNSASWTMVCSNYLVGAAESDTAISNFGPYNMIANNYVTAYGANGSTSVIFSAGVTEKSMLVNNILENCGGTGMALADAVSYIVSGNLLEGGTEATTGIDAFGDGSIVSDNILLNYGFADGYGIAGASAQSCLICGNVVDDPHTALAAAISVGNGSNGAIVAYNMLGTVTPLPLPNVGIEMEHVFSALVIGNSILGDGRFQQTHAIRNIGSSTIVCGNHISGPNGAGIHAINSTWSLIANNWVDGVPSSGGSPFGIEIWRSGDISIIGNQIQADHAAGGGIYAPSTDRASIIGNSVSNFDAGIWLQIQDGNPSAECLVASNFIQSSSYAGVVTDTGCVHTSVVGNYIINVDVGIEIWADSCAVIGNFITDYAVLAIDMIGFDDGCVVSNMGVDPDAGTTNVDGLDLRGCASTLAVGNWMESKGSGTGFLIDAAAEANDIVMAGNIARGGTSPSDGAGGAGTWPTGGSIDIVNCRHLP